MEQSASSVVGQSLPLRLPADRARVLLEINNAVVSHLDLAEVLKSVSACLRREIKHDFAALALYNPERHELRLHALDFPDDPTFLKQGQLIPLVGTPAALAFSSRKTVLRHRPDFSEFTADIMKLAYARGIRSGCAVPLICHDKIVGSMALASLHESAFTEDDAELLTQIGTQVAIAVDNAQNFEKTRLAQQEMERERDRSKLLLEVNNAVVSHLNLSELLKAISARLQEVMFNDSSFIALCSSENSLETLALDLGKLENVAFREGRRMPMEGTPEEQAISTGQPVLVRSVAEFARFPSSWVGYAVDHGIKSGCFNPLIAHGRRLGALGVVSLREDAFTPDSARLLEDISGQIAIAVENALNFQKAHQAEQVAKHERDRSQLLLDINNALVSHLDLTELVRAISNSLQSVVSNECVALAIYDSETDKLFAQAVSSVIDPMPEGIYYDPEGTTSGLVFKSGKPLYLPVPITKAFHHL
jgi:formate hydrogenlyase transcriptional activator